MLLVLNTMMEPLPGQKDTYLVHYSVLDGDVQGRAPSDRLFDKSNKSCLHKIAKSNNKVLTITTNYSKQYTSKINFVNCQTFQLQYS